MTPHHNPTFMQRAGMLSTRCIFSLSPMAAGQQ